jgi:hypothetical protein
MCSLSTRSRRLAHCNVTAHPTAAWTPQQLREAAGFEERYRYLLHDRDGIFAQHLDESATRLGIRMLKSPPRQFPTTVSSPRLFRSPTRKSVRRASELPRVLRAQPAANHGLRLLKSSTRRFTTGRTVRL